MPTLRNHYYLLNKPYGVLCQFTDAQGRKTLKDLGHLPESIYAAGRLDLDSEGLLLLTDDKELNHRLTEPKYEHPRTYLVQVEGIPAVDVLEKLRTGVRIHDVITKPSTVILLEHEPAVPPRTPPIRERKSIPTSWIELTLREGQNRQVRKMTAAVGHPTLRLIRIKIGELSLTGLKPGESVELNETQVRELRASLGL